MNFESALKAMREGKKVKYHEEIYWIDADDDPQKVVRYEYDETDGFLVTSVVCVAILFGADLLAEDWEVVEDD